MLLSDTTRSKTKICPVDLGRFSEPQSIFCRYNRHLPTDGRQTCRLDPTKRPADVVVNAVHVMRVATREAKETYVDTAQRKGGKARANALSAERRSEIAQHAAEKRWSSPSVNE